MPSATAGACPACRARRVRRATAPGCAGLPKSRRRIQQNISHRLGIFDVRDEQAWRILLQAGGIGPVKLPDIFEIRRRMQNLHRLNRATLPGGIVHDRYAWVEAVYECSRTGLIDSVVGREV